MTGGSTSTIEISRSSLKANLTFLKGLLGKVRISSVVKGNAYGHGIETFVPIAQRHGIDHFSVYSADEARRVKKVAYKKCAVMIMGVVEGADIRWAIGQGVSFFVFEMDRLKAAKDAAESLKKKARIHIEVETGMNRTGFNEKELKHAIDFVLENRKHFIVEGLCTHYAGAESIANYLRIKQQINRYQKAKRYVLSRGVQPEMFHTACSAAAVNYPETRMDMVRIGILQYGFWPSTETFINFVSKRKNKTDELRRLISWKSKVLSTKAVKVGEFIGYGTTYLAQRNMKVAVVPVGYAYGYARSLSNQGRVLINGHRVAVIGIVNMNVLSADITDVPETEKGDEVVLIGHQAGLDVSVASFSELSEQLNYELLTRLPESIPRIVVK